MQNPDTQKFLPVEAKIIVENVSLKLVERGHDKHFWLKKRSDLIGTAWKIANNTVLPRRTRKN